ncbi:MAG: DNA/RNA nuclease SfsA [Clostridia bacterium]|nr:DNA/RNA nuclease SfsA [Clostridia bacterium]
MKYSNITKGIFKDRPNRFIARVEVNGDLQICHVKNTGRCRELLIPGAEVFLEESQNPNRKTKYDLVAVWKAGRLFNIDSQAPNKVFGEWLDSCNHFGNITYVKPEFKFKNSRFDFYAETNTEKILIEVKGVTLEEDGVLLFPDAPTERGVKHISELIRAKEEGFRTAVAFVIQTDYARFFTPNNKTHPQFGDVLKTALDKGVEIIALCCDVTPDTLNIKDYVPVEI